MIDVLVRCKNEVHWLPQLLSSLSAQVGVELGRVLLLDNQSDDRPQDLLPLFPSLDVRIVQYEEAYLPGQMLNFGVRQLESELSRSRNDKLLIVSAHCFLLTTDSLQKLERVIDQSEGQVRAAYGRQVPMLQSDDQAVRDLSLLYPNEDRKASKAASFNNAFSMSRYVALREHLFDNFVTNLEDVLWAAEEIELGFSISYVSESVVAHHHGPHHGNVAERLATTRLTIEEYTSVFHFDPATARLDESEVLPVFITEGKNPALLQMISKWTESPRFVVWSTTDSVLTELADAIERNGGVSFNLLKRPLNVPDVRVSALYDVLPYLQNQLVEQNLHSNYYLVFDDSFSPEFSHVSPKLAATELSKNYQPALWPVVQANELLFTEVSPGSYLPSQVKERGQSWKKTLSFQAVRGNGLVLTAAALRAPEVAFSQFGFIQVETF